MGDTDLCPYDGGTHGPRVPEVSAKSFRGAAGRSQGCPTGVGGTTELRAPVEHLAVENGVVFDPKTPKPQNPKTPIVIALYYMHVINNVVKK